MADSGRSASYDNDDEKGNVLTNGSSNGGVALNHNCPYETSAADVFMPSPVVKPQDMDGNNDESLDYSDGDDGNQEGNYDMNSDKESAADSLSESGSYSPNADELQVDQSLLEQGTYRARSSAEQEGAADIGGPNNDDQPDWGDAAVGGQRRLIIEDLIDHAEHDMCDDSEDDLGSYHINSSSNDEADEDRLNESDMSEAEYDMSSGMDSDEAQDEFNNVELLRVKYNSRQENPVLPDTVSILETESGAKVYVVGTAHFSEKSQDDVAKLIQAVQPDVVMVELCKGRLSILQLDEETLLEEAKDLNMEKLRVSVKQHGIIGGVMQVLLLHMSAHLTKELGMAPGGEFRKAFQEAQEVPGCKVNLGDRPIQITLNRAMGALSTLQKLRLAWCLLTSKDPITSEDVERFKQKDLLMELLEEMMGEFPALSRVFVSERDIFLAHSLRICAQPIRHPTHEGAFISPVVVGVVGIGHMPGIIKQWKKPITVADINELMSVPPPSLSGRFLHWGLRVSVIGVVAWGCYKCIRWTGVVNGLFLE